MYVIMTEKGLTDDGRMEYEYFGITLQRGKYGVDPNAINSRFLRTVLDENEKGAFDREGFDLATVDKRLLNYGVATFKSIADIAPSVSNEMIEAFRFLFGKFGEARKELEISPLLARFLESFKEANLEICQVTPKRTAYGDKDIEPLMFSNLSTAKTNTMILMLLTGKTTYRDLDGDEKPIVIGGRVRKAPSWTISSKVRWFGPIVERNPKIDEAGMKKTLNFPKIS